MAVSTASFIEWQMYFFGAYEPEVVRLARRLVKPKSIAVDVGANIGSHCLPLAASNAAATVVAFEPHPSLRAKLEKNKSLSGLSNLEISSQALSGESGESALYVPEEGAENEGMASLLALGGWRTLQVQVSTLDEYFASTEIPVSYIKIDVEGWEGAVLEGGANLLASYRPALIFEHDAEYWARAGYALHPVLEQLRDMGYKRFTSVTRGGLVPIDSSTPPFTNVYAEASD
jgi:FkbM family methyltransferase